MTRPMTDAPEITAAEYHAMQAKQPTRKYRNQPVEEDGYRFDSKAERARYRDLRLMERSGEIGELTLQPRFDLIVNGVKVGTYVGDFEYFRGDEQVIEDVKGVRTPIYRLKKRLMKAIHHIDITEIT